jgi:PAS domain S-box-containing protein
VATTPIGDNNTLSGVLIAGGHQDPPPESCLEYLLLLGEILSNIINKSYLISNLRSTIQDYKSNLSILESAKKIISDGIILVNHNLCIEEINPAAEIILGYNCIDVQQRKIDEILIGTDRLIPAIQLAFQGKRTPNLGDVKLHRCDGSEFHAEVGTFPIKDEDGSLGAFIVLRDQSEHEQNRIRTHQLEQRAVLGEVTAIFAHEVRNPINNISTGLQLLKEDTGSEDPNFDVIQRMLQDCNRLAGLMESVLVFSRPGNYTIIPLHVGDLLKRLIRLWTPRISRFNIELFMSVPDEDFIVMGDQRALEQVFTNLISNAIQAMQEMGGGTLGIKMSKLVNGNNNPIIQIDISDTGPGIDKKIRQKIFEPFFTTKNNGTGLGLAITKQIITTHKGSISLTTFPGGTVFHVNLPSYSNLENLK